MQYKSEEEKQQVVLYNLQRADKTLKEAILLANNQFRNGCANRLYYAAYYVVNALLMAHGIVTKTHSGTKSSFSQHFVKTGKFDKTYGRLLSGLFDSRQKGDYENIFAYDADSVLPLFEPVAEMITLIEIEIRASN